MRTIPNTFVCPSMDIITARPAGMNYEEYRKARRENQLKLKNRLRGLMVWKSSVIYTAEVKQVGPYGALETWGTLRGKAPKIRIEQ